MLPAHAGRELLADDSYLRIVEHPNYNPRRIAYLTGTEGPGPRLEDRQTYVDFAVSTLDNAASLWQHPFDRELGQEERSLLVALVSAGDQLRIEDLRKLYGGIALQLGAASGKSAFEGALRSLEGSMIQEYREYIDDAEEETLVAFRDPSVEEFLTEHVREDPGHTGALLRGAVAFEQIEWLVGTCKARYIDGLTDELASAIRRTYRAASIGWEYLVADDLSHVTLQSGGYDRTSRRFVAIRGFMQAQPQLEPLLRDWWNQHLVQALDEHETVIARHGSVGGREDLLALAEGGRDYLQTVPHGPRKLADAMARNPWSIGDWLCIARLQRFWPGLYGSRRWQDLRKRGADWVIEFLADYEPNSAALDDVRELVTSMELQIPAEILDRARESADYFDDFEDGLPAYERPPRAEPMRPASDEERALIRAMFERFARDTKPGE